MMERKGTCLLLALLATCGLAIGDEFDEYMKGQQKGVEELRRQEQEFYAQQDSAFIAYEKEIRALWNEFVESTPKRWVCYSGDFKARSTVDFEKGVITVNVVATPGDSLREVKSKIATQLTNILNVPDQVDGGTVLGRQVAVPGNPSQAMTPAGVAAYADELINQAKKSERRSDSGDKSIIYSINLSMVPNHVRIRAEKYRPIIEKYCKKYNVKPALVMSIIHVESYFSPMAYNRKGDAYGMMQIVPRYAGQVMNGLLYKNNAQPSGSMLFDPETNIAMGVGYIKYVRENYFAKVSDEVNQNYCIICSYNGGVGSVYKAMLGKMKKLTQTDSLKLFSSINGMSNREFYNKLRNDIPWEETRSYIRLVWDKYTNIYGNI